MAEIMKIIENYNKSPMDKKIEAILDNYAIFDRIIAGIESDLILDICDERAYCRRKKPVSEQYQCLIRFMMLFRESTKSNKRLDLMKLSSMECKDSSLKTQMEMFSVSRI